MSTAIDTDTDLDLIEHLDFDAPLACEATLDGHRCGKPATWLSRCRVCSTAGLWCGSCKARFVQQAMRGGIIGGRSGCRGCGSTRRWLDELVEWLPIGGQS